MPAQLLVVCFVSTVVSLLLTPVVRFLATRLGVVAQPKADRWHRQPTALLGGVAVYTTTALVVLLLGVVDEYKALFLGATAMFGVGLFDDVFGLKPEAKLAGQIVAACALVFWGGWATWTGSETADAMISILWVVAITNAFNLLDNMDGLCAGIASIAVMAFVWTAVGPEGESVRLFGMALAGALLGFLVYNFSPASIFLGDSGSLFVGFTLAGFTVGFDGPRDSQGLISVIAIPALILLLPILDTTLVTVARKLSGRAASRGGTDHLSHRLVAMGFSERSAVLILYGLAALSGGTAALVSMYGFSSVNLLIAPLLLGYLLLGLYLARVRVYRGEDFRLLRNQKYTPLLDHLTYKRRLFEILLDLGLVSFSFYGAHRLRFDADAFGVQFPAFIAALPGVVGCKVMAFWVCGVYRGVWRHVSLPDLAVHLRAVLLGGLSCVVALPYVFRIEGVPLSLFVIDALLLLFFLVSTRLSFRVLGEWANRQQSPTSRGVLIYGAGDAGVLLLRELLNNDDLDYRPVGFVDDDVRKQEQQIHGVGVLGGLDELEELFVKWDVDSVLLSTRSISAGRFERLEQICRKHATPLVVLDVQLREITPAVKRDLIHQS